MEENVVLTVPAQRAYLLVIRTALGGVALVNDLDVDTLDDLRQAADEACDCLMHQGAPAHTLRMESRTADTHLLVTLFASLGEVPGICPAPGELALSQAVLETLSIIAYRQPVTKGDVEGVRGVKCDYSVQTLVNRGFIEECGRRETLGRPILYRTTDKFLQHFGIESLD